MGFFAICHLGEHLANPGITRRVFALESSRQVVNYPVLLRSQPIHLSLCKTSVHMGVIVVTVLLEI